MIRFGGKTFGHWHPAAHINYPDQGPRHAYLAEFAPSGEHVFSKQLEIADDAEYVAPGPTGDVLVAGLRSRNAYIAAYCP